MTGMIDLQNDIPSAQRGGQGPGSLVRQAREGNKLSLEDLAAQIKLSRFTLDAIERDDFAQLNEPVYVRGYYRKLSKVLPVLEADLIAAYERVAGHKTPPHPSKLILAGDSELGSGRRVSLKTVAIIVVLGMVVGALAFWGKNRALTPAATVAAPAVTATEQHLSAPAVEPAAAPTLVPAAEMDPAAATVSEGASAAPAVTQAASTATTASAGALSIQFNDSSWTEVKDASGRVLLSGLVQSGASQTLDGTPPFEVFLGNAPAVKITYKGQPVDFTQFLRGDNTARITLP